VNDEIGGAVRLELFRYLVLYVSRVTGLHDGVGVSSTGSGKGITSSANNADRHWTPHVTLAKVYRCK